MVDSLLDKRKHVLWLQWLLVLAIGYLLYFNQSDQEYHPLAGVTLFVVNTVLNAGLLFMPSRYFERRAFDYTLVLLNMVMVSLTIYLSGQATADFYLFFFIILMMSAAGQNLQAFILGTSTATGLYLLMVYRSGDFSITEAFLLRIPLLFIVGLFFGYLVYLQSVGRERVLAESEFTSDLFEFGKALAQADDLGVLHAQIPKLVNHIMMTDACELAVIEEERITRRVYEGIRREVPPMAIQKSIHRETCSSNEIRTLSALPQNLDLARREDLELYPFQQYLGRSWRSEGRPAGLIAVYRNLKTDWSTHDLKKFQFLTDQTVLGLQYIQILKELETEARTDGLTNLANYRYFSERIEEEFSRARRINSPLSLILMDIDHFKSINDSQGHAVGDQILKRLAGVLKDSTRPMDLPGRCGGDEFAVLLPESDAGEARGFCNRLIDRIKSLDFSQIPPFSVSIGGTTFPDQSTTIAELFSHADEALYFAKSQGRACARHYSEVTAVS